ncbi:tRNA 4-thiouridine(8) synthase ThiI [Rubrobacter taiwanensis]|jgi:thiamine biosynthesis protein ThiI|uniref:tRNA sulfurtransferase n=1 Tax=Rubrobacter taiwanensis TaxID=185139 RepID=A0A4R1BDZ2_9ACTN|nr:THUMP domain-containing protein [Rubrobacter taiwanensis]TCJ15309.1 tRNA 4-thiouridine(8) synthase ThiI [Rubrobacter taiwanensis]
MRTGEKMRTYEEGRFRGDGGRRLLVRLSGEVGTKSRRTRRRFLGILVRNMYRALRAAGIRADIRPEWSRVFVSTGDPARAREALVRVFGIRSVAEVVEVPYTSLEGLVEELVPLFGGRVSGRTFAVRPRAERAPVSSRDVAYELGAALLPFSAGVDLDRPEVEVPVELTGERAFAVMESTPGPEGLPLGTGGRAVALFSGGFDSPVAAWRTMRRGVRLDLLICDLGGCGQIEQALAVARELAVRWAPGHGVRAHVVDLAPVVAALVRRVNPRLRQLLLKRAMYRAGSLLAGEVGAEALVTGESIGQVSTQTLRNLSVAERAAGLPVLRPLVGTEKNEIIDTARRIGTHGASAAVKEHCSIATGPVETWAEPEEVLGAEGELGRDVDEGWMRRAVENRRVIDLRHWEPEETPSYVVDRVPEGAVVVDVREPGEGPQVGEIRLPFSRAPELLGGLDRSREYLLVCASGRRSEILARELLERGYKASSLEGGVERLAAAQG